MPELKLVPRNEHLLRDAFQDFLLSREASLCSPRTIEYYRDCAGGFVSWAIAQGLDTPEAVKAQHVRAYISRVASRGVNDGTVHCHARATKTFLRFLVAEGYRQAHVSITMPRLSERRLPFLTANELGRVVEACRDARERCIVLMLADTGVRRAELLALNWEDVDLTTGAVRVEKGKGRKARTVVCGVYTRRALLKYRRTAPHEPTDALFTARGLCRLKGSGLRSILKRLGARSGMSLTAHALRRTFATLATRGGMNVFYLQALMGHSDLETTRRYVRLVRDDILDAHKQAGPVDHMLK